MSTKKETIESVSESTIGCQSQPPKSIKANDSGGPLKLQIAPNPKWNPLSEIGQNDIVVTPCSFQPETIDCHDSKNTIVFDISYFNNIFADCLATSTEVENKTVN